MSTKLKIHTNQISNFSNKKYLLAISGGADSMVLLDLCIKQNLNIEVAHCNFQLRGKDSDLDEKLVKDYCEDKQIKYHIKRFNTKQILEENKSSIQMLARELRYDWFKELKKINSYDFLVTAHHLNDQIETFFLHLTRGAGIDGLTGIEEINEDVFRPLLTYRKEELLTYAKENKIPFKHDNSNDSNKYKRNLIRNQIIPLFQELNPSFEHTMLQNLSYLKAEKNSLESHIKNSLKEVITTKNEVKKIHKEQLIQNHDYKLLLAHFLKNLSFNSSQIEEIIQFIETETIPGKKVETKNYVLVNDREFLLVYPKENKPVIDIIIKKEELNVTYPIHLSFEKDIPVDEVRINKEASMAFLDANKLIYPLTLRKWKQGDFFTPLGMRGKKKISDFLIDLKIDVIKKDSIYVLETNNEICWVVGYRINDNFKITNHTQRVTIITTI